MSALARLDAALRLQPVQPDAVAGVRAALSLTAPFALGVALGEVERGGLMANGAFLVALCNTGGAYATRARVTAVAMIAVPVTTFVAVLAGNDAWMAAGVGALWMLTWSMTPLWGPRFAFLGLTTSVTYAVYLHSPGDWADAAEVLWLSALGGVWATMLSLAGWHLWRGRPGRKAVAAAFRAVAEEARAGDERSGDEARRSAESRTKSLDLATEVLGDIDASPIDMRGDLVALFELAHAIGQQVVLADDHVRTRPMASLDTAESCDRIADDLAGDRRWWGWPGRRPGRATLPQAIDEAVELLHALGGVLPADPQLRHRYRGRRPDVGTTSRLRSHLSFDSLLFRHAVRLSVAVAAAILLSDLTDIRNGYWIPMTVILVLKPEIGATLDRAVQRSAGTIVGAFVGAVIVITVDSDAWLTVMLFVFSWFVVTMAPLNYFFWALAITPLAIVIRDAGDLGDWWLAVSRTANSLIGVAIALIAGFALWPSWTRLRLPAAVDRLMSAFEVWTAAVVAALGAGRSDADELTLDPDSPHMRVLLDRTNVFISVDQLDQELPRHPAEVAAARTFEVAATTYTDAVAELARRLGEGPAVDARSLVVLDDEVHTAFDAHAVATAPGDSIGDVDVDRLRAQLRRLVAARDGLVSSPTGS